MAGTLGIATLETGVDLKGLDRGLNQGKQHTTGFLDQAKEGFANKFGMSAADAAMKAAGAVYDFARESVAEFRAFEAGVSEVFTLMPGASAEAMGQMKRDVLAFGVEVGRTSDEVLPALYQAISAGVPTDNVFDFMQIASDAALGGVTDLETAIDGITSVVNAYGAEVLDAATASDVMFTAVRLGKTDFSQLSSSLFNVIPTAASLGVSFADVAAQLAVLTAQGTPTSVATTQIRAAFVEASRDGTRLSNAIKDLTGKSFAELIAEGRTTSEIFDLLRQSVPENEFRGLFGSVEAMNAVLGITGPNAQSAADAFDQTSNSIGATAAAADTMRMTGEQASRELAASWEFLKITAGEQLGPAVTAVTRALTDLVQVVGNAIRIGSDLYGLWNTIVDLADAKLVTAWRELTGQTEENSEAVNKNAAETMAFKDTIDDAANSMVAANEVQVQAIALTEADIQAIRDAALERSALAGVNEELSDKIAQNTAHLTAEEAMVRNANAATAAFREELDAASAAQLAAAEAAAEHTRKMGDYFNSALTATGETATFERQLYDAAVASGAGATELMILAAATGEFTAAEIEAAFQAALMRENIEQLATAVANGTLTADEAVVALGALKSGQETTAAGAMGLASNMSAGAAALAEIRDRANEATTAVNSIPTSHNVHYTASGSISPPGSIPGGGEQPQAFQSGGWTGAAGGIVHPNELVVPAPVLRSGAAGILDFAERHVPGGVSGGSIIIQVDARGATDPAAVEAAGYRGAQAALREAGMRADTMRRTR